MPLINTRRLKDTLFGMLFVMRDGGKKPSQNAMRNLVILFLIDMGQVLRVLMSPFYGWNKATYDVAKHIDIVYNFTKICSFLVPRYTFFGIAFLLVVASIGDAFYCAKLFKAGDISKIGPVKTLRALVAIVVTTLFSSIMKWLLIPLECLASHEKSLSEYIHGDDAECMPWAFPEVVATIPTLVIVVIYVAFAFTATFFSVCTNPLAFAPNVQATGRVEALFLTSKVLATFLVFLSEHITPVATTVILFILNIAVLFRHLAVLPFHHHATNLLRGGIYTCLTWLSFASLLVAIIGTNDMIEAGVFQTMQWTLLAFLPVAFPLGIWITHFRRSSLLFSIDRLRGEYESYQMQAPGTALGTGDTASHSSVPPMKGNKFNPESGIASPGLAKHTPQGKPIGAPRDAYDNFFDPSWERKRAFGSGQHAHTIARTLLMQRNESDLPFLAYIITRSLEEHCDSEVLHIFRISLQRFVFRNTQEAAAEEKKLKGANKKLAMDYEYILYAVERKATQDYAASNMGNGNYNAINLMEFDSGMQNARNAHMNCIVAMRKFWSSVSSKRKKAGFNSQVESTVKHLVEFNRAQEKADAEYHALLEKYPQSVQLLQAYASYTDVVKNDVKHADSLRKQAAMLEEGDDESEEERTALGGQKDNGDASSAATSEHETFRLKTLRAFSNWSGTIWGQEWKHVMRMNRRVRVCCMALFLVSLTGFLVMQLWLFKSMAEKDVHLINMTGLLRAWAISSCFLIRTQFLKSLAGDAEAAAEIAGKVATLAGNLQAQHWSNYEIIRTEKVRDYYLEPSLEVSVPTGLGWSTETFTFWAFGTDWTRRMERASQASVAELQSSTNWAPKDVTEGKMNIQFLNENAFRAAIPAFESIVKLYEIEMQNLWHLTQTLVIACTSGNVALLVAIGCIVVWGVKQTIQQMQHMQLACILAIQLPAVTSKKLAHFYKEAEGELRCHEDEDEERKKLIEEDQCGNQCPLSVRRKGSIDPYTVDRVDSGDGSTSRGGRVKTLSAANLERFAKEFNHPLPGSPIPKLLAPSPKSLRRPPSRHRGRSASGSPLGFPAGGHATGAKRRNSMAKGQGPLKNEYVEEEEEEEEEKRIEVNTIDISLVNGHGLFNGHGLNGHSEMVFNDKHDLADLEDHHRLHAAEEEEAAADGAAMFPQMKVRSGREEEERDSEEEKKKRREEEEEEEEEEEGAGVWGSLSSKSRGSETEEEKAERRERKEKRTELTQRWGGLVKGVRKAKHAIVVSVPVQGEEEEEEEQNQDVSISSHAPMTVTDINDKQNKENRINADDKEEREREREREKKRERERKGSEESLSRSNAKAAGWFNSPRGTLRQPKLPNLVMHESNENPDLEPSVSLKPPPEVRAQMKSSMKRRGGDDSDDEEESTLIMPPTVSFKVNSLHRPTKKVGFFKALMSGSVKDLFSSSKGSKSAVFGSSGSKKNLQLGRSASAESGRDARAHGEEHEEEEEMELLPLNEVTDEQREAVATCMRKELPLWVRTSVHLTVALICIGLSVLNTTYPTRQMHQLVTLAPTINQAGRRRFLTRSCVHLSRELVLDDGFSRMKKAEIASALHFYLSELKVANDAVRLGGALDITVGADHRNEEHNRIMYGKGCPWRDDPTDCSTPERPGAASNGLYHLSLSFFDAIQSVLIRYGPDPPFEYTDAFLTNPRLNLTEEKDFETVIVDKNKTMLLSSDPELVFVLNSFAGDMFAGFALLVEVFDQELRDIVMFATEDNQSIFVVYMLATFIGFYLLLFRNAVRCASAETSKARAFVARIPSYTLSQLEIDTVASIFSGERPDI